MHNLCNDTIENDADRCAVCILQYGKHRFDLNLVLASTDE